MGKNRKIRQKTAIEKNSIVNFRLNSDYNSKYEKRLYKINSINICIKL